MVAAVGNTDFTVTFQPRLGGGATGDFSNSLDFIRTHAAALPAHFLFRANSTEQRDLWVQSIAGAKRAKELIVRANSPFNYESL